MSIPEAKVRTCKCPCCKRLFKGTVTAVKELQRARWLFDWPSLLCVDCCKEPQAVNGQKCPHPVTENPERQPR